MVAPLFLACNQVFFSAVIKVPAKSNIAISEKHHRFFQGVSRLLWNAFFFLLERWEIKCWRPNDRFGFNEVCMACCEPVALVVGHHHHVAYHTVADEESFAGETDAVGSVPQQFVFNATFGVGKEIIEVGRTEISLNLRE